MTPRQVNVHEAKTHLSRLLEEVEAGGEVIIARSGKAIARLAPLNKAAPRKPGLARGRVGMDFFRPLDLDAFGEAR